MREKMMAFCGSKMELISACFKKTGSTSDQTCCEEKGKKQDISCSRDRLW